MQLRQVLHFWRCPYGSDVAISTSAYELQLQASYTHWSFARGRFVYPGRFLLDTRTSYSKACNVHYNVASPRVGDAGFLEAVTVSNTS